MYSNGYQIGVQCCNEAGTSGSRPGCVMGVTFAEAEEVCENAGLRLCTVDEVKNWIGQGSGCQFDHGSVWTSTECFVSRFTAKSAKLNVLGSGLSGSSEATTVVSLDLSSRWAVGLMVIVAVLLAMNLWRRNAPTRKYAKISYADSEEFTEHEAKAINIE